MESVSKTQTDTAKRPPTTIVRKKKTRFFETYISKVLKHVSPENGITANAKQQLNSAICLVSREVARHVISLTEIAKKKTMSEKEVKRKSYKVMDLDEKVVRQHYVDGTQVLICGHIHKEQHRDYQLGARRGDLYVLGSWDHAAPFLVASLNGQFQFANGGVCDSDYD